MAAWSIVCGHLDTAPNQFALPNFGAKRYAANDLRQSRITNAIASSTAGTLQFLSVLEATELENMNMQAESTPHNLI